MKKSCLKHEPSQMSPFLKKISTLFTNCLIATRSDSGIVFNINYQRVFGQMKI